MAFVAESAAIERRCDDNLSDLMDALIFGYLSRQHYELTCKAFIDESPSLNKKLSEQSNDATTDTPPSIEISLHGKLLEEIVAMFAELGSFVAPPQFVQFGLKLRQLSSEFATLMGAGWSETQQQLYGRKATLRTRTQPVSLAGGVRNFQTGQSNFTIIREPLPDPVATVAVADFSSPEKTGSAALESRRRKAPPRHLANTNVILSPLKEASTNQPTTSAFPMITFDSFDTLLDSGLADALADGINRNLHGDLSEFQTTAFGDLNAIVNDILSTDTDGIFKAFNMAPGNQPNSGDGGQLSSGEQLLELHDGSTDEAELMNGWDPLQNAQESPMKIAQVVIDEMEEGEIADDRTPCSKKAEDLSVKVTYTVNPPSSSSSTSIPSVTDGARQPTKSTKPSHSHSLEPDLPLSTSSSASSSKSDVAVKSMKNKKGSSAEPTVVSTSASSSTAVPSAEAVQISKTKKEKGKSSSIDSFDRRLAPEAKKNDKEKRDKEKEKEKEKEDGKKKKDRIAQSSNSSSKESPDKNKQLFGPNHVVAKRLYPDHQCTSASMMFANSDLFESESPTRKRPKHSAEAFVSAIAHKRPIPKVDSARRKLIDSMSELRCLSPPSSTAGGREKDRPRDERRTSALGNDKHRDVNSLEVARMRRSKSRSPTLPHSSATKALESSKKELRQKEKPVPSNTHGENRVPNSKTIARKQPTPSPTSSKGSSGSTKKRERTPPQKSVCTGVGKYRPIQLVGGSHSAKVGIVLEKAARARRQAEKEKVDVAAVVVPEAPSVCRTAPRPAQTSSQLSPPVKSSPLKQTELPLDDSELIDMSTNTALTDATDRNLIVLRMIDEATGSPSKTNSPGMGSVSDLAAYCEQKCGFRLNLPAASPQKVRVDNARMESVLALLHGTKR